MNPLRIQKETFDNESDSTLRVEMVVDAIKQSIDGQLTAATMVLLNNAQTTLIAFDILRKEVMDGGFVQLIYNGYGGFMFLNPVAKIMRLWGLRDLSKLLYAGRKLYLKYKDDIERDRTDEEFMAMFEQFEEFDDLDDAFIENEEEWTDAVARYVEEHFSEFVTSE